MKKGLEIDSSPKMRSPLNRLVMLGVLVFLGCASPRSLFVQMYDPKTSRTLNCSARQAPGENRETLYDAVEACVRQLEARGFVRVKNGPEQSGQPTDNQASPTGK